MKLTPLQENWIAGDLAAYDPRDGGLDVKRRRFMSETDYFLLNNLFWHGLESFKKTAKNCGYKAAEILARNSLDENGFTFD